MSPSVVNRRRSFRRVVLVTAAALSTPAFGAERALAAQEYVSMANAALTRRLVMSVLRSSPLLSQPAAEIATAHARTAAAGFAPPMVLSFGVEELPDGVQLSRGNIRAELSREFLTGGRSSAARALAAMDARSAELALDAARQRVTARTLRSLSDAVAGGHEASRLATEDSLLEAAEVSVRDRFAVGEARYIDVLRLRTERLRVQTDRARALADARAGRDALIALAGAGAADSITALVDSAMLLLPRSLDDPLPAAPPLDSLLDASTVGRQAGASVARANAALVAARAELRPRIAASLGAQRFTDGDDATLSPVLGFSVTLPFTAASANRAIVSVAEREVALAEAARTSVRARLRANVAAALTHYESARDRLTAYDAALLRGARDERESALVAYRDGELSLLELLDFERALAHAEIERVRVRAEAVAAYADLILEAAGGDPAEPNR